MKNWILGALFLVTAPLAAVNTTNVAQTIVQQHGYTEISGQQLKSWYDQGRQMVVLDARTKPYFDGNLLPGAKWLPADASNSEIQSAIPSLDTTIVVYCTSLQCPASQSLANRLVAMGYKNVYKYPEGLQDWMQRGFPTSKS